MAYLRKNCTITYENYYPQVDTIIITRLECTLNCTYLFIDKLYVTFSIFAVFRLQPVQSFLDIQRRNETCLCQQSAQSPHFLRPRGKDHSTLYCHRDTLCNTSLFFEKSELLFEKSELLFEKSELLYEKSEFLFEKSELLFEKSELLFEKFELLFEKSELLFEKSELLFEKSELLFEKYV